MVHKAKGLGYPSRLDSEVTVGSPSMKIRGESQPNKKGRLCKDKLSSLPAKDKISYAYL